MIGTVATKPVNVQDIVILPEAIDKLMAFAHRIGLQIKGSPLTLDPGFDSIENKKVIRTHGLIPVIKPNRRNIKEPIAIARLYRWFNRATYKKRFTIERSFAWQDTYRRVATSYDRLPATRSGFRYLAYSLINFRTTFGKKS